MYVSLIVWCAITAIFVCLQISPLQLTKCALTYLHQIQDASMTDLLKLT